MIRGVPATDRVQERQGQPTRRVSPERYVPSPTILWEQRLVPASQKSPGTSQASCRSAAGCRAGDGSRRAEESMAFLMARTALLASECELRVDQALIGLTATAPPWCLITMSSRGPRVGSLLRKPAARSMTQRASTPKRPPPRKPAHEDPDAGEPFSTRAASSRSASGTRNLAKLHLQVTWVSLSSTRAVTRAVPVRRVNVPTTISARPRGSPSRPPCHEASQIPAAAMAVPAPTSPSPATTTARVRKTWICPSPPPARSAMYGYRRAEGRH